MVFISKSSRWSLSHDSTHKTPMELRHSLDTKHILQVLLLNSKRDLIAHQPLKSRNACLVSVARLVECRPMHQKVTSLIPGQGTCSGRGLNPRGGGVLWEATDPCFSLTSMFLPLPPSLSKKKKKKSIKSPCFSLAPSLSKKPIKTDFKKPQILVLIILLEARCTKCVQGAQPSQPWFSLESRPEGHPIYCSAVRPFGRFAYYTFIIIDHHHYRYFSLSTSEVQSAVLSISHGTYK
uniref:Uncharacterized protein n=1 Tax=Myotis myotis TaxID=51298 RepID=A0A7J7VZ79_MYOMY|nr:hypothetical protein mMyoMyo1_012318 [Myotis myotis]